MPESTSRGVYTYFPQTRDKSGKPVRSQGQPKFMFRIWLNKKAYTEAGFDTEEEAMKARYTLISDLDRGLVNFEDIIKSKEKRPRCLTFAGMIAELADREQVDRLKIIVKDPATNMKYIEANSYCFKQNGRKPAEQRKDAQKIARLLHVFGDCPAQVPDERILKFVNRRKENRSVFGGHVQERTVRLDFNILKRLLAIGKALKLVMNNTAADVEELINWQTNQPKKRENARKYIDSTTMRKIVAGAVRHMRTVEDWAFWIILMAYTGNRPAQIFRLRLEDFSPADKIVKVNPAAEKSSYHRAGYGRHVIIDSRLTKYLRWWAWRHGMVFDRDKGFVMPDGTQAKGQLFTHVPTSSGASKQFSRIVERYAGITDISAYSLHHTAASDFANSAFAAGYDLKFIADHLGCTVPTLMGVYLKSGCDRVINVGDVMQAGHLQKRPHNVYTTGSRRTA